MVPTRGMEYPPSPLLGAPPEATEPLLLGARPPQGPLAHFTLCWHEGREEGEKEGEEGITPGYSRMPQGSPSHLLFLPEPEAGGTLDPEGKKAREPQDGGGRGAWGGK